MTRRPTPSPCSPNSAPIMHSSCIPAVARLAEMTRSLVQLGDGQEDEFNLVSALRDRLPRIDGHDPTILIHNDAVVRGVSELPKMGDVSRWGVLTIGTGLGNARIINRRRQR